LGLWLIPTKLHAAAAESGRDVDRLAAIYPPGSIPNCRRVHHIAARR